MEYTRTGGRNAFVPDIYFHIRHWILMPFFVVALVLMVRWGVDVLGALAAAQTPTFWMAARFVLASGAAGLSLLVWEIGENEVEWREHENRTMRCKRCGTEI